MSIKRRLLCLVLGWLAGSASAAQAIDPALLDYLEKFGDQKGQVFDPADLEEADRIDTAHDQGKEAETVRRTGTVKKPESRDHD